MMRILILTVTLMFLITHGVYAPHAKGEEPKTKKEHGIVHSHDHGDGVEHPHQAMLVHPQDISVEPKQAVVQVKGIVCSFCSYGTEKNLSKLNFLDSSKLGGNGVITDIKTGRTTLAIKEGETIDFEGIHKAVKKGGYEPVSVHFRLSGELTKSDKGLVITTDDGRTFLITGESPSSFKVGENIDIQVHVHGDDIPNLNQDPLIPVMIDKLEA